MINAANTPVQQFSAEEIEQPRLSRSPVRKPRFGDRKDGRLLRSMYSMNKFMPFVMPERSDALNYFTDELDITATDVFCKDMIRKGYENFSMLHILLAAYVRTVSQKPGINRFVSGQRIFARRRIEVVMVVKKDMTEASPETCVKVCFEPDDTVVDVYNKFNAVVQATKEDSALDSHFDHAADRLASMPRPMIRASVNFLRWLDYHGKLPRSWMEVSPFHGSMIITSMGSLGIKPIYHHIYSFGNLPIFFSYGVKRTEYSLSADGQTRSRRVVDLKVTMDERICDGFYFAAAFKMMRRLIQRPDTLLVRPDMICDDID